MLREGHSLVGKRLTLDSGGQSLDFEIAEIYPTYDQMRESTSAMAGSFLSDCYYGDRPARGVWMADLTDFRQILCIGHDSNQAPLCLDFRDGGPSVILWDGYAWRRAAQDFSEFLKLAGAAA